jgi:uncharacterized MAPEG superfamily protein
MTIAFWCVLAAILLPYLCFGIARNRGRGPDGRRLRENRYPRAFPDQIDGLAERAWNAHLNSFESLPGFAAAAIIAHLARSPQALVDLLAIFWVLVRLAYVAFYLGDRSTLRTCAQVVSLLVVLALFAIAGLYGS